MSSSHEFALPQSLSRRTGEQSPNRVANALLALLVVSIALAIGAVALTRTGGVTHAPLNVTSTRDPIAAAVLHSSAYRADTGALAAAQAVDARARALDARAGR